MGTVNWNLTANEEQFLRGCLKASNAIDKVGNKAAAAGRKSKFAFAGAGREAVRMVTAVAGIGGAVGGILMVANQLRAEYRHLVDQQKRAAEAQMDSGNARAVALLNKPAGVDTAWLDKLVTTTAADRKVDQKRLWQLAGQMLSSKGALSNKSFAAAFSQSSRVGALTGEGVDLPTLGGGLQDVMRITGGTDPAKAGGWIRQIGQQSRIVDLQAQIQAIVPAISSAKPFGWKPEQSAEFMSYLTMMSGDTEGRKSSTGTISFMGQLDKARTAGGAIIPQRGLGGKIGFRPLKTRGPAAIGELQDWYAQADPAMREEFRAKLQGEKKIKGGLLSLIGREPEAMKAYKEIQSNITAPGAAGVSGSWESYFTDVAKGKTEPVRALTRLYNAETQKNEINNTRAAAGSVNRQGLEKWMRSIDISDAAVKGSMIGWEANSGIGTGDATQAAIGTISRIKRRYGYGMKYKTYNQSWSPGAGGDSYAATMPEFTGGTPYGPNPKYDPAQAEQIREMVNQLKALRADLIDKGIKTIIAGDKRPPALKPGAQTEG